MITWLRQFLLFAFLSCFSVVLSAASEKRLLALGTGGVTGLYYPAGGALCRLVNLSRQQHGIRCAVRSTLGSLTNLTQVSNGELDLGIAESGQLYNAVQGRGRFAKQGADNSFRALFNLFPEYLSILVKNDAAIQTFEDLRGKRVNIGKEGSSQRITLELLMQQRDWQWQDFAEVLELEPAQQAAALCGNQIDATLYVVGHPSGAIKEAIRDCDSRLLPLSERDVKALITGNPHYQQVAIKGRNYAEGLEDISTAGVNATLFTRANLPDDVAYAVVKALFEQFDRFRRMHPAFQKLTPQQMIATSMAAPLHPGAERYYREAGLLELVGP